MPHYIKSHIFFVMSMTALLHYLYSVYFASHFSHFYANDLNYKFNIYTVCPIKFTLHSVIFLWKRKKMLQTFFLNIQLVQNWTCKKLFDFGIRLFHIIEYLQHIYIF